MKIGLVTRCYPPLVRGGAHLSVYYIAKGLAENGHEVHVLTAKRPNQNSPRGATGIWDRPNIRCHEIFPAFNPRTAWDMDRGSWAMGRQLSRFLGRRGLHLDILHSYGMDTIPAVVRAKRFGRTAATFNGYWATCPFWDHTDPVTHQLNSVCGYRRLGRCVTRRDALKSAPRRWGKWHFLFASLRFRQYFARRLALLLPISRSMQSILLENGFPRERMCVCYNMVDPVEYEHSDPTYIHHRYGIPSERRILLHAGRFAPYKGSGEILRAAPVILAQHPDVHFVFMGQGSTLPALEAQAHLASLDAHVTFGGFVNPREMPHVYASSYAVLHTATWPEPFARGPIEAMAAGTAVVGTSTGGTPEVIRDEETGLLIPPFDAPGLASACNRLLANPALRARLAKQGRALVFRQFSIKGQIGACPELLTNYRLQPSIWNCLLRYAPSDSSTYRRGYACGV